MLRCFLVLMLYSWIAPLVHFYQYDLPNSSVVAFLVGLTYEEKEGTSLFAMIYVDSYLLFQEKIHPQSGIDWYSTK